MLRGRARKGAAIVSEDQTAAAHQSRMAGDIERALIQYRAEAARRPDDAVAWLNLGGMLREMGRAAEAEAPLRRSVQLDRANPASTHTLATTLFALGRYREGWSFYGDRFEMASYDSLKADLPYPKWRSWFVGGKTILIWAEQGHGDQIQFARFAPLLRNQGARVILLCYPALERLFSDSFPGVQVIATVGPVSFPDPDFWVASSDLPGLCGTTIETIPTSPYLRSRPAPSTTREGFRIGLMVNGNPKQVNDARRSLPPAMAERLRAGLPGTIVSLVPEETGAADFADTAAIVDQLDLVVSVDTSVAHLAGALGKRVLTLIPGFATDWRWGIGRDDSAWYPTMRLYRSTMDMQWEEAIDRLIADARAIAGA